MVTVTEFVVRLLASIVDLVVIFLTRVAISDPLSFVVFAIGAGLTTFAVAVFGYLALMALVDGLGGDGGGATDVPGRTPPPRD